MELTKLENSSLLTGHAYDADQKVLHLEFKGAKDKPGNRGTFENVSQEQYDDFLAAESQGKWYHANLRGNEKHPYAKFERK